MKIELLTLQCIKNYGSVLQTYATQKILGEFFEEVETIRFIRDDSADENMLNEWVKYDKDLKAKIKKIALMPMCSRYKKVFNLFLNKYVRLTKQEYRTDDDFVKHPLMADAFCVGSDQVWNSSWNQGILPAMYLEFVPDNKMKFSFCSSFGVTELPSNEVDDTKRLLDRIEYISVRESTAVDLLARLGINNAQHLLDPTLLMPAEFWENISSPRLVKEKYVLVYQLNPNQEFDEYAKRFADKKNMKLVYIGMRMKDRFKKGKVFLMPEVEQFLSLIQYASYVITDSFHGTAFSLNFNRELIDIYPNEFSTRLSSILKWAGISNRHLTNFNDFAIAEDKIDYDSINQKLNEERIKARKFLKDVKNDIKE